LLSDQNRAFAAFAIAFVVMIVEFVAGFYAKSMALVSDACHMLIHAFAYGIVVWALLSSPRNERKEACAALVNGIILLSMVVYIFFSASYRFFHPENVSWKTIMIVAPIGLFVNFLQFAALRHGDRKNVGIKSAIAHVIGDMLVSVGVIFGGIVIYFTKWSKFDSIVAFCVGFVILKYGIEVVRDSLKVLKRLKYKTPT
jgi:cobalt-zinc-cadmium efflux system protein